MRLLKRILTGVIVTVAALGSGACGNDDVSGPNIGTLEVLLLMEGADQDPNGGTLLLNGDVVGALAVNVRWRDEVEVGIHVIEVTDISLNCTILGTLERNVTIRPGEVARAEFRFLCESTAVKDPGDGEGPVV
jgi:hypothetical protein